MDIDPSSPQTAFQRQSLACSPGLGDLFEENGLDASSPAGSTSAVNRKRSMADADTSFTEQQDLSSSPGQLASGPNAASLSKASGARPRVIHRANSAASLGGGNSRRRSSAQNVSTGGSGSSTFFAALIKEQQHKQQEYSGRAAHGSDPAERHRKMSRGSDGLPNQVKAGRRAQSMCDSEFYASPPLGQADESSGGDYFGAGSRRAKEQLVRRSSTAPDDEEEEEVLLHESTSSKKSTGSTTKAGLLAPPEDMLSPQRPRLPALNSYQPSPEASFTCGFGHKEAQGKILPCFPVTEDGLMRITASTLNELLTGTYDDSIDQYLIIDCRFDYEYQGGHIEGAINLGTSEAVEQFLLNPSPESLYQTRAEMPYPTKSGETCPVTGSTKKSILIFHCEFSAKRAPTLATHLRGRDRALNHAYYPAIHYPEVYVLQGGYANCFKQYPVSSRAAHIRL